MTYEQANKVKGLAPDVIKVLEELEGLEWVEYLKEQKGGIVHRWKWQAQVGEWCLNNKLLKGSPLLINKGSEPDVKHYTPILEWEEIERVLEKAGYKVLIGHRIEGKYFCWILGNKTADAWGKTRQQAVMKAVIALGKELSKE